MSRSAPSSGIRWLLVSVIAAVLCLAGTLATAADAETAAEATAVEQQKWDSLDTLVSTIDAKRNELAALRRELGVSADPAETHRLQGEISQVELDINSLQTAWEMLATDGADLSLFGVRVESAFNWRTELQSVFEPLLAELRRVTERPRKIERLRNDQAYYQRRLAVADEALQSIGGYLDRAPTATLKSAFAELQNRWKKRRDDLNGHLQAINLELREVSSTDSRSRRESIQALKQLLSGHVLNLLIGLVVMALVYLLLRGAAQLYHRRVVRAARRRTLLIRLGNLLFYSVTLLFVLLSGMAVFYLRSDWVMLGLFIILLIGAAWALQKSLPRYLLEARLMLNLGPVREGERIVYHDLPWQVKSLGFYCTLVNPLLSGGSWQLPLRELVGYVSRVYDAGEPWFPTQAGDYVMLENGNYGRVITQTPEIVQVLVLGAVKTFPATSFVEQHPRNLSQQGFTLVTAFGLDYQHQATITTSVCDELEKDVAAALARTDCAAGLNSLSVEFSQAGASSLDLVLIANFSGEAAESYFRIQRLLQRLAVEACNRHGWVIPFNQITVHEAT